MVAASVEVMLDLGSSALREGKDRLRPLFRHPSVAESGVVTLTAAGPAQGGACGFLSPYAVARAHVTSDQTPKAAVR
jgi:hypothetical protein